MLAACCHCDIDSFAVDRLYLIVPFFFFLVCLAHRAFDSGTVDSTSAGGVTMTSARSLADSRCADFLEAKYESTVIFRNILSLIPLVLAGSFVPSLQKLQIWSTTRWFFVEKHGGC